MASHLGQDLRHEKGFEDLAVEKLVPDFARWDRYECCEHSIDMKTGLSICVLVTEGENGPRVHR